MKARSHSLARRFFVPISVLILLYLAAVWAFALPPFKSAPLFYKSVALKGQSYRCNAGEGANISIRFEQNGRIALVHAGDRTVRLVYKNSESMFDTYESGPWRLTLNPEANLTGPSGIGFSNCF